MLDSHREALVATDASFGGACALSLILAMFTWLNGESSYMAPLAILGFLACNVVVSQISLRVSNAYYVEVLRAVAGFLIVPGAYILVDGPLHPWWLGAMINSLGGAIVLGLLTKKPLWGRIISLYYVVLLGAAVWLSNSNHDWYEYCIHAIGLAMVGFLFAEIMSLLGRAMAKEHERSKELVAVRDALFAEMEVAQEIQTLLLPVAPEMEGLEIACSMQTASEVGGDYYDVLEVDGRSFLAIGDVSGHGVSSGLTMMMARTSLVAALEANSKLSLPELYCTINRCIGLSLARMDMKMYMTFALMEHMGEGRFEGVGRHLPFLIHRAATNTIEEVELQGVWLGVIDSLQPEHIPVRSIEIQPGDTLLGYTDGVIEHSSEDDEEKMFGVENLGETFLRCVPDGPQAVVEAIIQELNQVSTSPQDDITMLIVRRNVAQEGARPIPFPNNVPNEATNEDERPQPESRGWPVNG